MTYSYQIVHVTLRLDIQLSKLVFGFQVLCWGVRDVKRLLALPVKHPYAEIEVGGIVKQTGVVRNAAKNPLFENPFILTLDVVRII